MIVSCVARGGGRISDVERSTSVTWEKTIVLAAAGQSYTE